jgi:transcriptional regulator of acetoin/glycerol metabolism
MGVFTPCTMSFPASVIDQRIRQAMKGDSALANSWKRSLERYQIDPGLSTPPRVYSKVQLKDYQTPLEDLMHTAREGMNQLSRQVRDAGYVVLLTDPQGVTVDFVNNESYDKELRHAGLYLGACWSESVEGTCAVGVCAHELAPVTVHHDEHFRSPNTTLTCSSAPVFGPGGDLLAVLDASALYSPHDKRSQHLVLQMVSQTARLVENAYFLREHRQHNILYLSESRHLLDVHVSLVLALDEAGRVIAANSQARHILGDHSDGQAGHEWTFMGADISQVLGLDMPALATQSHRAKGDAFELRHVASARRYFAKLTHPTQPRVTRALADHVHAASVGTDLQALHVLAGADPLMMSNVLKASRVMNKGISVLLHGETGTGKEMFAQAMHQCSARQAQAFIALNCAAIPESLIESELFGYVDGAFTGARSKGGKGKIQQADGGTLFLDEIGDMPLALQTRLLRVLAEGEVMPLGAEVPVKVDVQVICASHRQLLSMVEDGRFRQDLYFRLSGIVIELPALREREDLDALIEQLLHSQTRAQSRLFIPTITSEAYDLLKSYAWPGNIRQLKNVLRTAIALCERNQIEPRHLPGELQSGMAIPLLPPRLASGEPLASCTARSKQPDSALTEKSTQLLEQLRQERWNITQVARQMGVSRSTIYRRMERNGINPPV